MYCIKIGNNYVTRKGNKTNDINIAYKMNCLEDCAVFMAAKVSKSQIYSCKIVDIDTMENVEGFNSSDSEEVTTGMGDIKNTIRNIFEISDSVESVMNNLNKEYKEVELEICDIYHYIEINNLSASEGYKVYKKLQDTLKKRRVIKDNMQRFRMFDEIFSGKILGRLNEVYTFENDRSYHPRVDKKMFKEGI